MQVRQLVITHQLNFTWSMPLNAGDTVHYLCPTKLYLVITTKLRWDIAISQVLNFAWSSCWSLPYPPLDNIRVMVIVWRLRGNIIRTALCWVVWHNQQHTPMSSSYRSSRLDLSHWDPYAMHRGGCLELYYCNMVEWSWYDSSLIWKTNWFPSVLWHCWFGHMTCKNRLRYDL